MGIVLIQYPSSVFKMKLHLWQEIQEIIYSREVIILK